MTVGILCLTLNIFSLSPAITDYVIVALTNGFEIQHTLLTSTVELFKNWPRYTTFKN